MKDNQTLAPTAKRRLQARQEGRVAASGSLVGAACWLALACFVACCGVQMSARMQASITAVWSVPVIQPSAESIDPIRRLFQQAAFSTTGILCIILAVALFTRLAQVGFLWAPRRVLPQPNRIAGSLDRVNVFSPERWLQAVRLLVVFGLLVGGMFGSVWIERELIAKTMVSPNIGDAVLYVARHWGLRIAMGLFLLGLLDYGLQRYHFEQSLWMTPEELRTEVQAVQQNPQIGAGRRSLRESLATRSAPSENS